MSSIATPSGWYEVIRDPRPPSVQWPLASKGKGKDKGMQPSTVVSALLKSQQSKVARLEAALQALGQEQSPAKTALEKALKVAKEDVPKPMQSQVGRLEAALQMLGEDDPDAEPLKVALKKVRVQAQVRLWGSVSISASSTSHE